MAGGPGNASRPHVTDRRSAPTLETERLVLRAMRADDLAPLAMLWANPGVTRHIGGRPLSAEETWRKALAGVGQWPLFGFGYWVVERKSDGALVGHMGFADFRRGLLRDMDDAPELGYVFTPAVHGSGIAGESCRAALAWLDAAGDSSPVWAIIEPDNAASIRLAERLGFSRHAETTYHDAPTVVFKRPAC